MPTYEYEVLDEDGAPKGIFETRQKMSDPPLARHPVTGEPLRRILSRTFIGTAGGGSDVGTCSTGTCGIASGGCAGGTCGWD